MSQGRTRIIGRLRVSLVLAAAALAGSCAYDPNSEFPVMEGSIEDGRRAFVDHRCNQCHSVAGVSLPTVAGSSGVMLELGGETSIVRSYSGLMTSIINPDHSISTAYRERLGLNAEIPIESPMPMPEIDNMTVRQLIDLVTFLDSRYILTDDYAR